jgi:hypothetical protein
METSFSALGVRGAAADSALVLALTFSARRGQIGAQAPELRRDQERDRERGQKVNRREANVASSAGPSGTPTRGEQGSGQRRLRPTSSRTAAKLERVVANLRRMDDARGRPPRSSS